ncbi:MAG TPA: hypothetical protein VHD56_13265 [Tepidisphaeraceae bacterium]|nr:hypothetical protein [Tepidisphaeraceae bacterium]
MWLHLWAVSAALLCAGSNLAQSIGLAPTGYAGSSSPPGTPPSNDFLPLPDRWRIGIPPGYVQNVGGHIYDPYNQNLLKGDYPLPRTQDLFMNVTVTSDTLLETRRLPVPSGVSSENPNSLDFFGMGKQYFANENLITSISLFKGDAGYKPRDWEVRFTPIFNVNYLDVEEQGIVNPDVRQGSNREDSWIGFQEAFVELRSPFESRNFDFASVRAGIQGFTSDFRGFLYSDNEPGIRLFGNADNNKIQWNIAWFHQLEKDTNSGLNSYSARNQDVFIANVYIQDSLSRLWPRLNPTDVFGYTTQFSVQANLDNGDDGEIQYDDNGVIVRPAPIGTIHEKDVRAYYIGWAGDGHIGRFNLTHQFYQAFGEESFNPIAGRRTDINAQFFAAEISYDQDWLRYRASFVYASGDDDPTDGTARGFDSIFDNPNFAGGGFSFLTRQAIRLTGSGVNLVNRNSFLPDLRTSKEQGQANFVNPGLFLYNVGVDAEITPKLKAIFNVSYVQLASTNSIKLLLHDNRISEDFGIDYSLGLQYRPLLNNNVIFTAGVAIFQPLRGYEDIYQAATEYSLFTGMTFTY